MTGEEARAMPWFQFKSNGIPTLLVTTDLAVDMLFAAMDPVFKTEVCEELPDGKDGLTYVELYMHPCATSSHYKS